MHFCIVFLSIEHTWKQKKWPDGREKHLESTCISVLHSLPIYTLVPAIIDFWTGLHSITSLLTQVFIKSDPRKYVAFDRFARPKKRKRRKRRNDHHLRLCKEHIKSRHCYHGRSKETRARGVGPPSSWDAIFVNSTISTDRPRVQRLNIRKRKNRRFYRSKERPSPTTTFR